MNITTEDQQLTTMQAARAFDHDLYGVLEFAELLEMRVARLWDATEDKLGGWPDGYEFPKEAVAACAVVASTLETEAERMQMMAKRLRERPAHLWLTRGEGDA